MLDRTAPPPFVRDTSFHLIDPALVTLPNGVRIFFVEGGSQDVLKIELIFRAGRWFEERWGSAYFASHLLSKGTASKSSYEIAELFDRYGAHLEVNAGLDYVAISLYALSKKFVPVMDLLREILHEPDFPEKELHQAKAIYIQNLKINQEKTSYLASQYFRKHLFGENHPYGKELTEGDVAALDRTALTAYHTRFLKDFTVFVSGRVGDNNRRYIRESFAGWKTAPAPAVTTSVAYGPAAEHHYEKESSVQASLRIGRPSLMRKDPGFAEAVFVAHILGGYFGSRLMKNIREEKGLTYGIHAALHPLQHAGYFVIGADVNKENTSLTFAEIRKELKRLRTEPVSVDELETARNHFIGSLQAELTTPFAHADKLRTIYLNDLPSSYYRDMILSIEAIDAAIIMEVASRYFHEDHFLQISVG